MNDVKRGFLVVALLLIMLQESFLILVVLKFGLPQVLALLPSGAATFRGPALQAFCRAAMTLQREPWLLRAILLSVWMPLLPIAVVPKLRKINELLLAFWSFAVLMFVATWATAMLQMLAVASSHLR